MAERAPSREQLSKYAQQQWEVYARMLQPGRSQARRAFACNMPLGPLAVYIYVEGSIPMAARIACLNPKQNGNQVNFVLRMSPAFRHHSLCLDHAGINAVPGRQPG